MLYHQLLPHGGVLSCHVMLWLWHCVWTLSLYWFIDQEFSQWRLRRLQAADNKVMFGSISSFLMRQRQNVCLRILKTNIKYKSRSNFNILLFEESELYFVLTTVMLNQNCGRRNHYFFVHDVTSEIFLPIRCELTAASFKIQKCESIRFCPEEYWLKNSILNAGLLLVMNTLLYWYFYLSQESRIPHSLLKSCFYINESQSSNKISALIL